MDLATIKSGEFYQVLERAVELTATQARFEITELGVKEPQRYKPLLTVPVHEHEQLKLPPGVDQRHYQARMIDWYSARPEAFLAYIQYRAALESADESRKAEGYAIQAQRDAAVSIDIANTSLDWAKAGFWTAAGIGSVSIILQVVAFCIT